MIAIYTKDGLESDPVLRFEHDADPEAAVIEVLKRYPKYMGEYPAQDVIGRMIWWFARACDDRMCGVGYNCLPAPAAALTP